MNKSERQMVVAVKLRETINEENRKKDAEKKILVDTLNANFTEDIMSLRKDLDAIRKKYKTLVEKAEKIGKGTNVKGVSLHTSASMSAKKNDYGSSDPWTPVEFTANAYYGQDLEKYPDVQSSKIVEKLMQMREEKNPNIAKVIEKGLALITGGTDEDVEAFMKL